MKRKTPRENKPTQVEREWRKEQKGPPEEGDGQLIRTTPEETEKRDAGGMEGSEPLTPRNRSPAEKSCK